MDLGRTVYRADRYRFQATLMRRAHRERGRQAMRRSRAARSLALAMGIAGVRRDAGGGHAEDQAGTTPAAAVKTDGFEDLGDVTLKVISSEGSGGPRDALRELSSSSRRSTRTSRSTIQFRDFASWIKQAKLVASGDDPPDVFAGNQGYQLDGELVKAGLILPLDKYAKAYGWEESFTPETLQQFKWTRRRRDVRRGHAVGRRPDRPVRRRVRQQGEAGRGGRRSRERWRRSTTSRPRWPRCASRCRPTSR